MTNFAEVKLSKETHELIKKIPKNELSDFLQNIIQTGSISTEEIEEYFKPQDCMVYWCKSDDIGSIKIKEKFPGNKVIVLDNKNQLNYFDSMSGQLTRVLEVTVGDPNALEKLKKSIKTTYQWKSDEIAVPSNSKEEKKDNKADTKTMDALTPRKANSQELELISAVVLAPEYNFSQQNKELKPLHEALRASILKDICKHLNGGNEPIIPRKKQSFWNKFKYWLLALAGGVFFGCEGFDGITAILGLFSIPAIISLGVGILFSIFAVFVFKGFGLKQIADHLNVEFEEAAELIDNYVQQFVEIERINQTINQLFDQMITDLSAEGQEFEDQKLKSYRSLIQMFYGRLEYLRQQKQELDIARSDWGVNAIKYSMGAVTGIIFFSGGFFTGQAVAVSIASFFMTASVTFPPIIAVSVLIGLAAFFVYWNLERPGIDRLIGRKIYKLDDDKIKEIESVKLDGLKRSLESTDKRVTEKVSLIKTMAENNILKQQYKMVQVELDKTKAELSTQTLEVAELNKKLIVVPPVPVGLARTSVAVSNESSYADNAPVEVATSEQRTEDRGSGSEDRKQRTEVSEPKPCVDVKPSEIAQSFFNSESGPALSSVTVVIPPEDPNKDDLPSEVLATPAASS